jgi:adhesin/invasin
VTVTANAIAGSYSITANTAGAPTSATFALTNTAGAAGQITFVQQPTNTAAGVTIAPAVTARLLDGTGNPVAGAGVTLHLQGGTATLGGTVSGTTDATGLATFSDLRITTAGSHQLLAVSSNISAVSNTFVISPTHSAVLISVFSGDGQSADAGTAYGAPLRASVQDPYGNTIPGASVTFTAPTSGASVTFGGSATVTSDNNGIATSPAIIANSQAGAFRVSATTSGAASPALFSLTNLAATANRLAFIQQPTDALTGATITPPVTVQLQDAFGNAVHTAGIAVSLQANPVAPQARQLSGTATQNTDANGLATFADLSITQPGAYQLQASASGVASATSQTFHITAGIAALILTSGGSPQSAVIHTAFGAPLQVTVTDAARNPVSGAAVVFAAPTSGPSGLFGGQSTATVATDAEGHASAVITANGTAGSYSVTASSSAITGSATFALTNLPGGANSLVFVQQPTNTAAGQTISPAVTVRIQDASVQPISVVGVPIVLTLSSGRGTLLGTLVQLTRDTGVATFNDLHIAETGTKRLRATADQQILAESNTFQITAGAAATITAISGTTQSATVLTQFLSLLRAQVKDSASNPVSGVTVTFSADSSGASGTFAGAVTVTTDSNGIATAPLLTANGQAGNFTITALAAGVTLPAVFSLTNLPRQSTTILVDPDQLPFTSEINQPAPSGQTVQVTSGLSWTLSSSASWLSAIPAGGSASAVITVKVNPAGLSVGVRTGSIRITASDGSVALVFVTYTITDKPALVITPHSLVFTTGSNSVIPAAQILTATSSLPRTIAYRVSPQVSTPSGGTWLQVSSTQGQTTGSVTVTSNPAGLSRGIYDGSVVFAPMDTGVSTVAVPVTLLVDCAQGGCLMQPNILAVVNGASFQPGGAPGAAMTIFGTSLSDAAHQATSFPLPAQLGSTTVTVNGVAVPLYYVSPTQINFQMPFGAPSATVQVAVNNQATFGARAVRASSPHASALSDVDPGIFITSGRRAAALNVDLSVHTAATPIAAGDFVLLFLTGQGPVTPVVIEGVAAPALPLSLINGTVQVSIGGKNATVTYQGLAPGFAGLAQLNAIVPAGLAAGDQPVFVSINGVSSNVGVITVK